MRNTSWLMIGLIVLAVLPWGLLSGILHAAVLLLIPLFLVIVPLVGIGTNVPALPALSGAELDAAKRVRGSARRACALRLLLGVGLCVGQIGILFRIMHWPNGANMMLVGFVIAGLLSVLLALSSFLVRNKEDGKMIPWRIDLGLAVVSLTYCWVRLAPLVM